MEITLSSGRTITADMVILSIGVRPENKLAKEAGLTIGSTGGIWVNEFLQTSDDHIYALGDAIEFPNPITNTPAITYLAEPANKQGRICADNISQGNHKPYKGAINTAIAKVFDITVASTGLSEKTLTKEGIRFESIITHSSSHAGYYPDAMAMTLKTLFDRETGRIYGAQILGYQGVDKRIDLIAAIIRRNGTVEDLIDLEHAYAPPYSSAKDPVHIAGYVADNIMTGRSRHIHWHQIQGCDQNEIQLIDVRTAEEAGLGTIEGAINLPIHELRNRLGEVPNNKTLVVFCGVGQRAYMAERILRQSGFEDVYNLSGGYKTYEFAVQKQSNEDIFARDIIWKDDHIYQAAPQDSRTSSGPGDSPLSPPTSLQEIAPLEVDAVGLQCPGPILALKKQIDKAQPGQRIREVASDPGFAKDVEAWCTMTGNTLLELEEHRGRITALVEKARAQDSPPLHSSRNPLPGTELKNHATLVVFSDDLDRALASLVIANGAASAGKQVTLFFTFWGLSILKKTARPRVRKDLLGKAFGWMLPGNTTKLGLSKINMGGAGAALMRRRMKAKGVQSLEQMLTDAIDSGIRLVACQMSMDVMGVKREELLDEVEIGGVASYLNAASQGNINLFV